MQDAGEPEIKGAAAEWFVRMRDEAVSEADRAAFHAWLGADPVHAAAYRELQRVWAGLDQVDRVPRSGTGGARAGTGPHRMPPKQAGGIASSGRRTALRRLAIAASAIFAVALGGYAVSSPGLFADYRTAAGEQRSVTLDDGSRLQLNTASAISTEFSDRERRVTLHSGEVYFEVASDPARPFVVDAGLGEVVVLGTAFSVRRSDEAVDITVAENRVAVAAAGRERAVVSAGNGVRITGAGLGPVETRNVETALAWRRGRLVFDGTPLSEVLADLERYRTGRIVVMDAAVKDVPVTGAFTIARHEQALETIERTLPVRLVRLSDLLILVFAGTAGSD